MQSRPTSKPAVSVLCVALLVDLAPAQESKARGRSTTTLAAYRGVEKFIADRGPRDGTIQTRSIAYRYSVWNRTAGSDSVRCASCFRLQCGNPSLRAIATIPRQKQLELDNQMERLRPIRRLLEQVQQCRSLELLDCGQLATVSWILPTRRLGARWNGIGR